MRAWLALLLLLLAGVAHAERPVDRAQQQELDQIRARVADQVQLQAYDLVDELVYRWSVEPVFEAPTPVVLADVTVPVGLGAGMQALLENHLAGVLLENPRTNLRLVHCPACTQVVVQSGPEATVVTRGIDNPAMLERLGTGGDRHALFLDIEAEGSFLVLRARLTRLDPDLPVVWSQTLATSTATPALLRDGTDLKSAKEAREEYLAALRDRGPAHVIARAGVRGYARPGGQSTPPPPFYWVQAGVELGTTQALDWTVSMVVGGSHIPQAYSGLMGEVRLHRLITGRARSHVHPDLYLFGGLSIQALWGPSSTPFQLQQVTADDVLRANQGQPPRFILGTYEVGLDLRLGQRIGLSTFLEYYPTLRNSPNLGEHVRVLGIGFQSLGAEVLLCF